MNQFRRYLSVVENPFLLTTLFAVLGWCFTRLIDKVSMVPVLEFSVKHPTGSDANTFRYTFRNISHSESFDNLKLLIVSKSDSIKKYDLQIPPPNFIDKNNDSIALDRINHSFFFRLTKLNPKSEFNLILITTGKNPVPVRISSDGSIRITQSNLITFLIKNEFVILGALIIIWLGLIILYISAK